MPSWSAIRDSNSRITDVDVPNVAVFVGASVTSGIGKATLTLLLKKQTKIKVYILGRGKAKSLQYLAALRKLNTNAEVLWLEGDLSLLSEVKRLCAEIKRIETRIDLLFLAAGYLPFGGRSETSEGLDACVTLQYWSRALYIQQLLPLLNHRSGPKTTYVPRVIDIEDASFEDLSSTPLDDLDLKKPENYKLGKVAEVFATQNTTFLNTVASQVKNSNVVFIHNHPGLVRTDLFKKGWGSQSWGPLLMTLTYPLLILGTISIDAAAERCLYLITSAEYGGSGVELSHGVSAMAPASAPFIGQSGGLFCINSKVETSHPEEFLERSKEVGADKKIWDETQRVIGPFL